MLRILTAVAVGLVACQAASADEAHRFVPLGGERGDPALSFLDTAATWTSGGEIEIAVLDARFDYSVGPDAPRPIVGDIRHYRVSCDWRAQKGPISTSFYNGAGVLIGSRPATTELHMSFYGKAASFAPAIDKVCGLSTAEDALTFGSVKEALAHAATLITAPPPPPAPPPPAASPSPAVKKGAAPRVVMMAVPVVQERKVALPGFDEFAPHRFSVVARDETKGHTQFLDWANMKREGDGVVALTLTVLGDESAPVPAPQWRWPVLALRSTRFDCKAQTVEVLGEAFGYKDLSLNPQPRSDLPARAVASSPVARAALKAACGAEPGTTYAGVADAFTFARAPR
jgi:hypothetical protein